jgi:hypothetical protein
MNEAARIAPRTADFQGRSALDDRSNVLSVPVEWPLIEEVGGVSSSEGFRRCVVIIGVVGSFSSVSRS